MTAILRLAVFKPATQPGPIATPPSVPTSLAVTQSGNIPTITWTPSVATAGAVVAGYRILGSYNSGPYMLLGGASGASYVDSGAPNNTLCSYEVQAYDSFLNQSAFSSPISITTGNAGLGADTTAPPVPVLPTLVEQITTTPWNYRVSWPTVTDAPPMGGGQIVSGTKGYNVYEDTGSGPVFAAFVPQPTTLGPALNLDIGGPSVSGSDNGTGVMTAGGLAHYGTSDQGHYDSQTIQGNFDFQIQVDSVVSAYNYSAFYLECRATTDPSAQYFNALAVTAAGNLINSEHRALPGGQAGQGTFVPAIAFPMLLRVTRTGNVFTSLYATDTTATPATPGKWTQLDQQTIVMPTTVQIGRFASAQLAATTVTVNYSHYTVSAQAAATYDGTGGNGVTKSVTVKSLDNANPANVSAASSALSIVWSGGGATNAQYPRLSWENAALSNGDPRVIDRCTHMDVVVLGNNFDGQAKANGYNRQTVVAAMKVGDGFVVPKVQQYCFDVAWDTNSADQQYPGGDSQTWTEIVNSMNEAWFLLRSDLGSSPWGAHGPCIPQSPYLNCVGGYLHAVQSGNPSSTWQLNYAATATYLGNAQSAAFAAWFASLFLLGTTGVADNADDCAPDIDGPWHDETFGSLPNTVGDYLQTGNSSQAGNDSVAMAASRAGLAGFFNWFRAQSSGPASGKFLMGNLTPNNDLSDQPGVYIYNRPDPTVAFSSLWGLLDAGMDEVVFGPQSWESGHGFEEVRRSIQFCEAAVRHPEYNMINHDGINTTSSTQGGILSGCDSALNASAGQALRYSLCMTLCTSSGTHAILDDLFWFDYYSVNPSTLQALDYATSTNAAIGAGRYWLGRPIDGIQKTPTQGRCYARRYAMPNGRTALVLANPSGQGGNSGAAAQTIDLTGQFGGTWSRVRASGGSNCGNNPTLNDGATGLSSVTIPVGDALILVQ